VSIATFDSKNANRDSHMLETTETLRFPDITFSVDVVKKQENTYSVSRELSFHVVTNVNLIVRTIAGLV